MERRVGGGRGAMEVVEERVKERDVFVNADKWQHEA